MCDSLGFVERCTAMMRCGGRYRSLETVIIYGRCLRPWYECLDVVDVIILLLRCCEARTLRHEMSEFWKRNPVQRIELEDPPYDVVHLWSERQDGGEEVRVLHKGPEGLVCGSRSPLPRIAAAGKVDEHHSKGPYIVGPRGIIFGSPRRLGLTF